MEQVKLLFIGSGNMGGRFARIASQMGDAKVAAVCDADEKRAQELGKELNAPVFTDYNKMFEENKDAGGVVITSPSASISVCSSARGSGVVGLGGRGSQQPASSRAAANGATVMARRLICHLPSRRWPS